MNVRIKALDNILRRSLPSAVIGLTLFSQTTFSQSETSDLSHDAHQTSLSAVGQSLIGDPLLSPDYKLGMVIDLQALSAYAIS